MYRGGLVNKLYRSKKNKIIAGVCGGIGEYFKIDPTLVRLLWLLFSVVTGGVGGVAAYIVAWIIIPDEPQESWRAFQKKLFYELLKKGFVENPSKSVSTG